MVSNPFGEPLTVEVNADTSGLESGLSGAMNKLNSFKGAAAAAGVGLAALSAKGIATTVSAAADLDAALKESQAIMGDLTNKQMKGMEEAAREVGRTTTFSADEAGEAFYYLASAGMDAEQSMAAIGDVAQFAQAGAFDLATATDLSTDALTSLGMAAEDPEENLENLNRVQDTFVRANELANASVEQYAQAMTNKLGPAMRSAGMEIEEGTAALAVFADAGLKGRRAGTILTRTIEGLQDGARENADAFQELGIQVFDAQGEMRPLQSIVADAEDAFEGMSTEQRAAAMEQLGFNQRSRQGMEILLGQSDALGEYQGELENAGGATQRVAEKQLESFNNQLELLKSQFTDIAIEIGGVFLPYLTKLVKVLGVLVGWFADFNSKTNGVAGAVTLLVGLFGGLIVAGGAIVSMMGGLSAVLAPVLAGFGALGSVIGILLGPIGILIGIVAVLGYAWSTNFAGIRDMTVRVSQAVMEGLKPILGILRIFKNRILKDFAAQWGNTSSGVEAAIARIVSAVGDKLVVGITAALNFIHVLLIKAYHWWAEHGETVVSIVVTIVNIIDTILVSGIQTGFAVIKQTITIATQAFGLLAQGISQAITVIWQNVLQPFIAWFIPIWRETMGPVVEEAAKTWSVWAQIVNYTITTIRANIGAFLEWLAPYWNAYWAEFNAQFQVFMAEMRAIWAIVGDDVIATARFVWDLVSSIVRGGLTIISGIMRTFAALLRADWSTAWNIIHQTVVDVVSGIGAFVLQWGERFVYRIGEIVLGVIDWFVKLGQRLIWGSLIPDMLTAIHNAFVQYLTAVLNFVKQTFDNILAFVTAQFTATKNFLVSTLTNIYQFFSQQFTLLRNLVSDIWSALHSDTESVWGAISTYLSGTLSNIQRLFSRQFSAIKDYVSRTLSNIYRAVRNQMSSVKQFFASTLGAMVRRVRTWASNAYSAFWNGLDRMYRALGTAGKKLKSRMSSIANGVVQRVKNVGSKMYNAGKNLIQSIVNGVKAKPNAVKNAVASHVGKAAKFLPWSDAEEGPLSNLSESGPGLVQTVAEGIRAEGGRMSDAVREMAAGARAFLPRSDADTGPLSDLQASGHSFGTTFAQGIRSSEAEVAAAANSLAETARGSLDNLNVNTEDGVDTLRRALGSLAGSQRNELASVLEESGFAEESFLASARLRRFSTGTEDQELADELSGGASHEKLKRLLEKETPDGPMTQAEDGSWVPLSYFGRDSPSGDEVTLSLKEIQSGELSSQIQSALSDDETDVLPTGEFGQIIDRAQDFLQTGREAILSSDFRMESLRNLADRLGKTGLESTSDESVIDFFERVVSGDRWEGLDAEAIRELTRQQRSQEQSKRSRSTGDAGVGDSIGILGGVSKEMDKLTSPAGGIGRRSPQQNQNQAPISEHFDSLAQSNRQAIQRLEGEMAQRLDTLITHAKNSEGVVRIDGKKAGEVIEGSMHRKKYSTEIHE